MMAFYIIVFLILGFILGFFAPKNILPIIVLSISSAWILAFGFGWAIATFVELCIGASVALIIKENKN